MKKSMLIVTLSNLLAACGCTDTCTAPTPIPTPTPVPTPTCTHTTEGDIPFRKYPLIQEGQKVQGPVMVKWFYGTMPNEYLVYIGWENTSYTLPPGHGGHYWQASGTTCLNMFQEEVTNNFPGKTSIVMTKWGVQPLPTSCSFDGDIDHGWDGGGKKTITTHGPTLVQWYTSPTNYTMYAIASAGTYTMPLGYGGHEWTAWNSTDYGSCELLFLQQTMQKHPGKLVEIVR